MLANIKSGELSEIQYQATLKSSGHCMRENAKPIWVCYKKSKYCIILTHNLRL